MGLPLRRARRALFRTLVVAFFGHLFFDFVRFCFRLTQPATLSKSSPPIDPLWGSILHRFENHPAQILPAPSLPWPDDWQPPDRQQPIRVLIVTAELAGLQQGGIGSAYAQLAEHLASSSDFAVTVLMARQENAMLPMKFEAAVEHYARRNISLLHLEKDARPMFPSGWTPLASIRVMRFLRERGHEFDVVHLPENSGIGYFSLLSKHEGLALANTHIIVGLHGPQVEWAAMLNKAYPDDRYSLELGFMERKTAEYADLVVSPSDYMLRYLTSKGWQLPKAHVIPNIVAPVDSELSQSAASSSEHAITELVYFARLEERKGARLMVQALEVLFEHPDRYPSNAIERITFMGRDYADPTAHVPTSSLVREAMEVLQRKAQKTISVSFLHDYDRSQALQYLRNASRLAIIPSLADNSPSTILECIGSSIRFIASNAGGLAELIDSRDAASVSFEPTADSLARKISELVNAPRPVVRSAPRALGASENWRRLHHWLVAHPSPGKKLKPQTMSISICITHYERAELLEQLLGSIMDQTVRPLEVILIDDGSPSSTTQTALDDIHGRFFTNTSWTMLRTTNHYLGEARNIAASHAKGTHLLFLDDDDVLVPEALQILTSVASHTNVDALSSFLDEFASDANPLTATFLPHRRTYWFMGQSGSVGMIGNCFGSGNILVKRPVFDAVGGFSTLRNVGGEDWEFYMKLVSAGKTQLVVPQELIFARSDASRASMKYSMDPWDASFRAASPVLASTDVQRLGIGGALMFAKARVERKTKPEPFADSIRHFELTQNWNGWSYSFEAPDFDIMPAKSYTPVVALGSWTLQGGRLTPPYISRHAQHGLVSETGVVVWAVRSWKSPRDLHASVIVQYEGKHTCGDGTHLIVLYRASDTAAFERLRTVSTIEEPKGTIVLDVDIKTGSTISLVVDPLADGDCDLVDVHFRVYPALGKKAAWSTIAEREELERRATNAKRSWERQARMEQSRARNPETPQPKSEKPQVQLVGKADVNSMYHFALIFDEARLPHAKQVVRSAKAHSASRELHFHFVAPVPLHGELVQWAHSQGVTAHVYDHSLCTRFAQYVLPFSDPSIHVSAHCKMFLPEIIRSQDRVLYLDTDISIVSDVGQCYGTPAGQSLFSMAVDMGDACQNKPDTCWPIGNHWIVPEGLECGTLPSLLKRRQKSCIKSGELETVQVNGGVIMLELLRMRQAEFTKQYLQTIAHHFKVTKQRARWGEQDFINSYLRLFPSDMAWLPCGCNYQWFARRNVAKCGGQPVSIAHAWSHGIATRSQNPYNKLFFHYFDDLSGKPPDVPTIAATADGWKAPNMSDVVVTNRNCPLQRYDCSQPLKAGAFGEMVTLISRIVDPTFAKDFILNTQAVQYPIIQRMLAYPEGLMFPGIKMADVTTRLDLRVALNDYHQLCADCSDTMLSDRFCDKPSPFNRTEFFKCFCKSPDRTVQSHIELQHIVRESGVGSWVMFMPSTKLFRDSASLSHAMAQLDSPDQVLVFKSEVPKPAPLAIDDEDDDYDEDEAPSLLKRMTLRAEMDGIGFILHSSHLDLVEWNQQMCDSWSILSSLSSRLSIIPYEETLTVDHPFERHGSILSPTLLKADVFVFHTPGRTTWLDKTLKELRAMSSAQLELTIHIVSTDPEPPIAPEDAMDPAHSEAPIFIPFDKQTGLATLTAHLTSDLAILISDSITMNKAALDALVGFWIEDPRRLVGPFAPPDYAETRAQYPYIPYEVADPLISMPELYDRLSTRMMALSSDHLTALNEIVERDKVPPRCHDLLLNAIATRRSNGTAPPLRVVLPEDSIVDRVWECHIRQLWDVEYVDVTTFEPIDLRTHFKELEPVECRGIVEKAVKGLEPDLVDELLAQAAVEELGEWNDLLAPTVEVGLSTWHGMQIGTTHDPVPRERFLKARRKEKCYRD